MKVTQRECFSLPDEEAIGIYTHAITGRFAIELEKCMIVDGEQQEEYEEILAFKFSDDGTNYAYIARKENRDYFIVNGESLNNYDYVKPNTLTSGPDQSFAFSARTEDEVWVIYKNKKYGPLESHPGDSYQRTSPLAFNTTGENIAFAGKRNGLYAVQINDKRFIQEYTFARSLVFGANESLAFRARLNDSWFIIFNNQTWGPYEDCCSPAISQDGNECGFLAENENGIFSFINGKPVQGPFTSMGLSFHFTSSGFAYEAEDKDGAFVMMNGNQGPLFDSTKGLTLSKDGQSYTYIAQTDDNIGEVMMLNHTSYGPYKDLDHPPAISPDGTHSACLVLDNLPFVIVNNEKGPTFENMYGDMHWSQDGKKLFYIVERKGHLVLVEHCF